MLESNRMDPARSREKLDTPNAQEVSRILASGADPNVPDELGETPIFEAWRYTAVIWRCWGSDSKLDANYLHPFVIYIYTFLTFFASFSFFFGGSLRHWTSRETSPRGVSIYHFNSCMSSTWPGHRGGSYQHRGVVVDVSSRSRISIFTGHGSTTDGLRTHGSLIGPVARFEGFWLPSTLLNCIFLKW